MLKYLISICLTCVLSIHTIWAQPNWDRIKAIKKAFIIEKLDLNTQESDKFWPLYEQYEKERYNLKNKRNNNSKNSSEMSNQEALNYINQILDARAQEVSIQKAYFEKFEKILPPQKVMKLLRIDEQFRQYLFRQARNKNK